MKRLTVKAWLFFLLSIVWLMVFLILNASWTMSKELNEEKSLQAIFGVLQKIECVDEGGWHSNMNIGVKSSKSIHSYSIGFPYLSKKCEEFKIGSLLQKNVELTIQRNYRVVEFIVGKTVIISLEHAKRQHRDIALFDTLLTILMGTFVTFMVRVYWRGKIRRMAKVE